jgi:myo-inositol-1(or 4)-monophosphatase
MRLSKHQTTEIDKLIIHTGEFLRSQQSIIKPEEIIIKGRNDFVSRVDIEAEKRLVEGLSKILPNSKIIAEEGSGEDQLTDELTWIIDPLDGTTNFLHGLPCFSISVALLSNREIIYGWVYEVSRDELFFAEKGEGAFLDKVKIFTRPCDKLINALLATGFPYNRYDHLDQYLSAFKAMLPVSRGIRRWGSAAVDLSYVACGRFNGFFETTLHCWDVAAGVLIAQEAGALVTDYLGGDNYLFGEQMLAASPEVHREMLQILTPIYS